MATGCVRDAKATRSMQLCKAEACVELLKVDDIPSSATDMNVCWYRAAKALVAISLTSRQLHTIASPAGPGMTTQSKPQSASRGTPSPTIPPLLLRQHAESRVLIDPPFRSYRALVRSSAFYSYSQCIDFGVLVDGTELLCILRYCLCYTAAAAVVPWVVCVVCCCFDVDAYHIG